MAGRRDIALYLRDHSDNPTMNRIQAETIVGLVLDAVDKFTGEDQ